MYDNVRGLCGDGNPAETKGLEQSEMVGLSIR